MALAMAGSGDFHKARAGVKFRNRLGADIAHGGAKATPQLVQNGTGGSAIGHLAFDALGHEQRYAFPVLTIIFLIASVVVLSKANPGAAHHTIPGGFLLTIGASFGYAVGWNPYASDYTRYMRPTVSKTAVAWWSFLGLFLSCVLLETVGATNNVVL